MLYQAPDGGLMAISPWPSWLTGRRPRMPSGVRTPTLGPSVRPKGQRSCHDALLPSFAHPHRLAASRELQRQHRRRHKLCHRLAPSPPHHYCL